MTVIDQATGREIAECPETESHKRHMAQLRTIRTTAARREYIDGVERAEGRFAAKWLRDEFRAEFEKAKA
jgi:hypothetical protein